ncbi:MAG: hypothetical protein V3T02_09780 [Alphaproteobacteria bacterium]
MMAGQNVGMVECEQSVVEIIEKLVAQAVEWLVTNGRTEAAE